MKPTRHVTAVLLAGGIRGRRLFEERRDVTGKERGRQAPRTKPVTRQANPRPRSGPAKKDSRRTRCRRSPASASFGDGEAAYHAKKYGEATAIFEALHRATPDNAWGHYMLGLSAWKSGDLAKSEQAFEQALSIDPNHVKSLVNLSRVFIDQKRHDDAVDAADACGRHRSRVDRGVSAARPNLCTRRARRTRPMAAYRRAIELNELDAWSMNNLGLLLLETKRADEALPLFAKAVELRQDVRGISQQPGHGARAHRAFQGRGRGLQRRTRRRPRLREGEAEPGARRSGQERA